MSITLHKMRGIEGKTEKILGTNFMLIEPPRPNGVKIFYIGKQVVWALNQKNAERKAKLYPDKEIIGG